MDLGVTQFLIVCPLLFLAGFVDAVVRMKLSSANGVAKVINLTTDLTSIAVFWHSGKVLVPLGLVAGLKQ